MITKKAEYAIIILAELATHPPGAVIPSREIARRQSIPVNLVVQLIAVLKEQGWTRGTRGPAGGISLDCDPATINLRQVIEAVDGNVGITRCLLNDKPCRERNRCSLRGVWDRAQQNMFTVLEEISISELGKEMAADC